MKLINPKNKITCSSILLALVLIICSFSSSPQEQFKYTYFSQYSPAQIKLIQQNWNEFFVRDIHESLNPEFDMFGLRMDGYGCIYPEDDILNGITEKDFSGSQKKKKQTDLTFFTLFSQDDGRICNNINTIKDPGMQEFYRQELYIAKHVTADSIDKFTDKWDSCFENRYINNLNARLKSENKKDVVFFIHGYNVPYSLANIQCSEFIKLARENGVNTDKFLFVPVYWPSNNQKYDSLDSMGFNILNETDVVNGSINASRWGYYTNRAYYASFTLRHILNALDPATSVRIFSHSLGATVATTALINTNAKLDTKFAFATQCLFYMLTPAQQALLHTEGQGVNYDLLKHLDTLLPQRKITVFMNAPAIPGYNTFINLDPVKGRNYKFYVGYNQADEMVTKKPSHHLADACNHGSTSLGANALCSDGCEISLTKNIFQKNHLDSNFIPLRSGIQTDHDIFSYFHQMGFNALLKAFFN